MESGVYYNIIGLLDRQADVTACKLADGWLRYKSGAEEEIANLMQKCNELREKYDPMKGVLNLHKRRAEELQKKLDHQQDATAEMVEEMWRALQNSVELPKDADGEYIRVGDTLVVYGEKRKCCELKLGTFGWRVHTPKSAHDPQTGGELHHYHAPTVADVLEEFIAEYKRDDSELSDGEIIEMFAKRLQLREEA